VLFPWVEAACRRLPPRLRANAEKVVAALNYWFRAAGRRGGLRAVVTRDGHLWVAKTDRDLARDCLLPASRLRRAVAALVEGELLVRRNWMFSRQRMGHYRLDWDKLQAAARRAGWRPEDEYVGGSEGLPGGADHWDDGEEDGHH
jgi:hypothetical protein